MSDDEDAPIPDINEDDDAKIDTEECDGGLVGARIRCMQKIKTQT